MRPRLARDLSLVALFGLALGVRLGWMPTWVRLRFDGHEALYLRAFQGHTPDASSQAWPAVSALYRALGWLSQDPHLLVVFTALSGALAVVGVALWTERRFGPWAGAWAGLLVALLGEHAAWSTSAYPVMLPHALLVWAFVVRKPAPAALLIALACSMRPELALVAWLRGWPGLAALVGPAWILALPHAVPSGPLLALRINLPLLRYLGPPVLALALLSPRRGLLLAVALVHLGGALFDDYGARHALLGGVLLCVLIGVAAQRWGGVIALVAATGLALDTAQIARVWQARPEPPEAHLPLPALPTDCVEVSEEPPIPGQPLPSHFRFYDGTIDAPCVVWGEEGQHLGWSSRGLRDRALRMRATYELTPIAVLRRRPGARVYFRLERP